MFDGTIVALIPLYMSLLFSQFRAVSSRDAFIFRIAAMKLIDERSSVGFYALSLAIFCPMQETNVKNCCTLFRF